MYNARAKAIILLKNSRISTVYNLDAEGTYKVPTSFTYIAKALRISPVKNLPLVELSIAIDIASKV